MSGSLFLRHSGTRAHNMHKAQLHREISEYSEVISNKRIYRPRAEIKHVAKIHYHGRIRMCLNQLLIHVAYNN